MTIAACYLSPEGLVFGADSTSTYTQGRAKHYNFGQKIFEIGLNSTLAVVTWGLGGLSVGSYRTLVARLSDDLEVSPPASVYEVCERWIDQFWGAYSAALAKEISLLGAVSAKGPLDQSNPLGTLATRSLQEEFFLTQTRRG